MKEKDTLCMHEPVFASRMKFSLQIDGRGVEEISSKIYAKLDLFWAPWCNH